MGGTGDGVLVPCILQTVETAEGGGTYGTAAVVVAAYMHALWCAGQTCSDNATMLRCYDAAYMHCARRGDSCDHADLQGTPLLYARWYVVVVLYVSLSFVKHRTARTNAKRENAPSPER